MCAVDERPPIGRRRLRFMTVLFVVIGACTSNIDRAVLCDRSVGLDNELETVNQMLDDIVNTSPLQLSNTFEITLATLTTLGDLGPSSLRSDFDVLLQVYESLATSIEATGWIGEVAVDDSGVTKARVRLVAKDVVEARESVHRYVAKNCSERDVNNGQEFQGTPTTLPNPDIPEDNAPDPMTGFDNEVTIASSYGYYVAEQYDLAVTNDQAICIGQALTEQAQLDLRSVDNAYIEFVSAILSKCGVEANISGS